ncbi:hypothetical protein LD13_gp227 [Bacillus phage Bobb]|uniref:Uncharacterized protein n=1 Tax=Bacillus phage Bobb TaxID=1527469 RepID=A0A076G732_9CAUD|nr:hypothetical protein LD13_gp227 [Bacillus phage Bobb]AII28122.1 hypothetical protein [Bacillus phage Bobb]
MADNDLKELLNELVDFEGIVKKIANALKEDLEKEVLKSDEGDKIANKLGSLFEDKENINQFIDNTVEEAQYLAQQKEGARKDAEKFAAMLKDQAKQATSALNEEEGTEVKEAVYPSDQVEAANPESLVSAVEWFFDLVGSDEDAHKFAEELQLFLPTHKNGNFGFSTDSGVSYGKYSLYNNHFVLQSGSVCVEYYLTEDDVTNPEIRKALFPSNEEDKSVDDVNTAEENLYSIRDDIEEAESGFFDQVEELMYNINVHYRENPPTLENITQDDEDVIIFYLTHKSSFYAPATLQAMSRYDLFREFVSKAELGK